MILLLASLLLPLLLLVCSKARPKVKTAQQQPPLVKPFPKASSRPQKTPPAAPSPSSNTESYSREWPSGSVTESKEPDWGRPLERMQSDSVKKSKKKRKDSLDDEPEKAPPKRAISLKMELVKEEPKKEKKEAEGGKKEEKEAEEKKKVEEAPQRKATKPEEPPLTISTQNLLWTEVGGQQLLKLTNNSYDAFAIKLKCSDNRLFVITPVFCQLQAGKSQLVVVTRSPGSPKQDKLVVCWAPYPATKDKKDLPAFFKTLQMQISTMDVPQIVEKSTAVKV